NSNETEVYTVATFSLAAICWLALRWRDTRGTARAPHCLLLIVYLAALSIGNHLLTLLVGPALSLFMYRTLRERPAADPRERRGEWSDWAALSALWIVLIGVGLGSTPLLAVGGLLLAGALAACVRAGSFGFPIVAVAVAAIGISTYTFLYIRSGLDPLLDEANPETWHNLLAVIRREQYPKRSPLDNPIFPAGPDNPGRTPLLFGQQLVNYFVYWVWQWGKGLRTLAVLPALLFTALGVLGFEEARRRDRAIAYLLGVLWLTTGIALVAYMNFKPGFSLFWDQYPAFDQHEVRERDYFFIVSFQVWGLFSGIGLVRVLRRWWRAAPPPRGVLAAAAGVALLPFALNFSAASRRHGPDVTVARDFAYNLLQSVEPYGVLFTNGDNDTFPVWYLQEVEGVRQDVTLINLSLANLDWYLEQLVTRPVRPFDPAGAPAIYGDRAPPAPPGPALALSAAEAVTLAPQRVPQDGMFQAAGLRLPVRAGQVFRTSDQVILLTIAAGLPAGRAVTFGVSSGRASWLGLDPHLVLRGLVYAVVPGRADTMPRFVRGLHGAMVDSARTARLADSVFRYGRLFETPPDSLVLEAASQQVATSFSIVYLELGNAAALRGYQRRALADLRRAYHLKPTRALADVIARIEREGVERLFGP
ncbi:MAG: protein O-mannosyl-transferase family, partial [Gemmatimonadales bacterium]